MPLMSVCNISNFPGHLVALTNIIGKCDNVTGHLPGSRYFHLDPGAFTNRTCILATNEDLPLPLGLWYSYRCDCTPQLWMDFVGFTVAFLILLFVIFPNKALIYILCNELKYYQHRQKAIYKCFKPHNPSADRHTDLKLCHWDNDDALL